MVSIRTSRVRGWPLRPPSWSLISLLLIVLLALAGCASSTVRRPRATPTVTPAATPAPTITQVNPAPLTLAQAWGHPTIHTLPLALPDNRVFVFDNAVTPDDQWLVGADEPRDFLTNTGHRPSYLSLYNIQSGQLVHLRALLHPASQVLAASADAHWVVWSEAADQPNFFDWTLFACDRQSGQVRQLAQAVTANGQAVPGPYPMPVVSAGRAIWGEAIGSMEFGPLTNAVVRLEDLASGQVTTPATGAGNPDLAWPWALWDQFDLSSGHANSTTGQNPGYVVIKNLSSGQAERLADQPATIVIDGTSVAWNDISSTPQSSSSDVSLINDITQGTNAYTQLVFGSDTFQYVTLNERIVAWTAFSETEVYDRVERRLVTLPVTRGISAPWAGEHTLLWGDPESQSQQDYDTRHNLIPAGTLNIIDTSTLPVQTGQ